MHPYVTEPEHIPATDLYADVPLYGRYRPKPGEFSVKPEHIGYHSAEAIRYWESVLRLCDESTRIYPADEGGRDVFALGNVIVKSSHLHNTPEIDYSFADANEVEAISIAKGVLRGIKVPEIYLAGKVLVLQCLYIILNTYTTSDTWSPSTYPRETSRRCFECCMAVPFKKSKAVLQRASTSYITTAAYHQAS